MPKPTVQSLFPCVSPVCRGRSHEMLVLSHLQPPLQGLDDEQAGQSRAVSTGDTDYQRSSCVAATLQRQPFRPCPCSLPGMQSRILRILQVSEQSGP